MILDEFHFLRPGWFLALLPALLLLTLLWRRRAGASVWQAVCDRHLLDRLWLQPPGKATRLPLVILGLGWLLAVLALAGPVWERQAQPVWRSQASRVLLLDLSASMDAPDLMPSRLDRARFKLMDILNQSLEGRIGLVVFAGEPHVVTPLTSDGDTIANLLAALSTDLVPARGDAGAPALQLGLKLLARAGVSRGDLLLLSDGLADPAAALGVAAELRRQGHRLSVLAVGAPAGAPIPGAGGGFSGMARLDAAPLRELARAGGGEFSLLTADDLDLQRVLLPPVDSLPLQEGQETGVERWIERGVWLLPLLLLLGAAGFRRGWLAGVLLICVLPPPVQAAQWQGLWQRPDQQAADALAKGESEAAAARFQNPAWRGMALYQSGDYPAAAQAFAQAEGLESAYNQGNALARAGELEAAVEVYRQVLQQAPEHEDAKANLALVESLLQQQKQKAESASEDPSQNDQSDAKEQPQEDEEQSTDKTQPEQGSEAEAGAREDETEGGEGEADPHASEEETDSAEGDPETQMPQGGDSEGEASGSSEPDEANNGPPPDSGQKPDAGEESVLPDLAKEMAPSEQDNGSAQPPEGTVLAEGQQPSEADMALEQWLRQIPEDPGGLLRRKFMLEHLRRQQGGR